jgi:hypothetical protein
MRGEGVLSLASGFFRAGARTVVASLWPLRDDEAARLFDAFYREVATGSSVGRALRSVQVEAIKSGFPAAAWAGLIVMGDGSAVPIRGGVAPSKSNGLSWVLALLGLGAGALLARRLWGA